MSRSGVGRGLLLLAALLSLVVPATAVADLVRGSEVPAVVAASALVSGADGNVWAAWPGLVQRITPSGQVTRFVVSQKVRPTYPLILVAGPAGVWFSLADEGRLGRVGYDGRVAQFDIGGRAASELALATDGGVWFYERGTGVVVRLDANGQVVREISLGEGASDRRLRAIEAGDGGAIWFVRFREASNRVRSDASLGRIDPDGAVSEIAISVFPEDLTTGPDGRFWFTSGGGVVGSLSTDGVARTFTVASGVMTEIVSAADGRMWFLGYPRILGWITTDGAFGLVPVLPVSNWHSVDVRGLAATPDGSVWYTLTDDPYEREDLKYDSNVVRLDTRGPFECRAPDLTGRTVSAARRLVERAGCVVGTVSRVRGAPRDVRWLRVLTQSAPAGRRGPAGSQISFLAGRPSCGPASRLNRDGRRKPCHR